MANRGLRLSDFDIRPARMEDYEGVMAISKGIYRGRDIIPSVYQEYLGDPNRVFYVATLNGKVASFAGGRICDNGETYEGEGARTDPTLRGSGLNLHLAVRTAILRDGVLPRWPRIKRVRVVTVGVREMRKQPGFRFLPNALRVVRESMWDIPRHVFLQHLAQLSRGLWHVRLPLTDIRPATEDHLRRIFLSSYVQDLFPDGVVIRDSQSFTVSSRYLTNIPLLLGDRLQAMFMTRASENSDSKIQSISFGTGIESGVDRDKMRYCIDYYGDPDCDVIKGHVFKHIQEIRACLEQSKVAQGVICHIFYPKLVYDVVNGDIVTFVTQELGFGPLPEKIENEGTIEQCVADALETPQQLATYKGKL